MALRLAELLIWSIRRDDLRVKCQLAGSADASNHRRGCKRPAGEILMLWTVFAILLLLWLLGWGFHVAGSLIHLILVIAVVVLLVEVITGRRAAI